MEIRSKKIKILAALIVLAAILYFISRKTNEQKKVIAEKIKAAPWFKTVIQEAANYNIPYERIAAIVAVESGGNVSARGEAGEFGLMQIMPIAHKAVQDHWARKVFISWIHPDSDLMGAEYNILVGTAYLALQVQRFNGNLDKATEAYNDGGGYGTDYLQKVKEFQNYF